MIPRIAALLLALAIGACTTADTREAKVNDACGGYAAAVNTITTAFHRGQVSPAIETSADALILAIDPFCNENADYADPSMNLAELRANMLKLLAIADELAAKEVN